ncbi:flavin reductase [Methylorubrum thiocyanatum]|uniref:flavin reductase n=1 Tax=Methylorubrum thiocyanatum TaxID=47958 RepID=UPI00383A7DC8
MAVLMENTSNTPHAADFRNAMSLLAGGVCVITTDGEAGLAGFTASAVTAVTDTPPTMLVCMNRSSYVYRSFVHNGVLCINFLSSTQQALSELFSNRDITAEQRFSQVPWQTLVTGAPALDRALVSLDGEIIDMHEVGTHTIFIVKISEIHVRSNISDFGGLAYFNRRYCIV